MEIGASPSCAVVRQRGPMLANVVVCSKKESLAGTLSQKIEYVYVEPDGTGDRSRRARPGGRPGARASEGPGWPDPLRQESQPHVIKLTDSQLVILSAAAQREDRYLCNAEKPEGRRGAKNRCDTPGGPIVPVPKRIPNLSRRAGCLRSASASWDTTPRRAGGNLRPSVFLPAQCSWRGCRFTSRERCRDWRCPALRRRQPGPSSTEARARRHAERAAPRHIRPNRW